MVLSAECWSVIIKFSIFTALWASCPLMLEFVFSGHSCLMSKSSPECHQSRKNRSGRNVIWSVPPKFLSPKLVDRPHNHDPYIFARWWMNTRRWVGTCWCVATAQTTSAPLNTHTWASPFSPLLPYPNQMLRSFHHPQPTGTLQSLKTQSVLAECAPISIPCCLLFRLRSHCMNW